MSGRAARAAKRRKQLVRLSLQLSQKLSDETLVSCIGWVIYQGYGLNLRERVRIKTDGTVEFSL